MNVDVDELAAPEVDASWREHADRERAPRLQALDRAVLEFLIVEGYRDAAEALAHEADLDATGDLSAVDTRQQIRESIDAGDVEGAFRRVNDISTDIFDTDNQLYLKLRVQQFIELIRKGALSEAINFAQTEFNVDQLTASDADEESSATAALRSEIQQAMGLLAFGQPQSSPLQGLLSVERRQHLASLINTAVLQAQGVEARTTLTNMVRLLEWCQEQMTEAGIAYPALNPAEAVEKAVTKLNASQPMEGTVV
ncbi:uncharacterized protein MONBRDRAFT_39214 [Monosiga brevicollis MX1]|uniref:CTLH domain-containing protein n=1 Tax=Monosiga brevicollis TaxID=81824 RepID=A9VCY8_MONBE|nr:uncharacterized protein MONBRDRAFT_39214 [Monosiga brevicollis MX1]EDQ84585.1 predicted protein [Monosiga brevicollis MX1]|eukprot:XP_001750612.1 hypothetical protein [Monosiga brevicollis MX1]